MNTFLIYILESTICISVFYLLFWLLMRKETSFAVNRATLLTIVVASVLVPLVQLPQLLQTPVHVELIPEFSENKIQIQNLPVDENTIASEAFPTVSESTPAINELTIPLETLLRYFYLAGVVVALLFFIRNVILIFLLSRKATVRQMDGYRLLIVDREVPSFAFGRSVVISQTDYDAHGSAILAHEQAHIRLNHFVDLMLLELIRTIHWFNPAVYALIGDMKEIHEFQADDKTLHSGIDATQYQLLVIKKGVGTRRFALANSFNHCQIKKRIIMMNKSKTSKAWRWKVATFLPLLALLLLFFGGKRGNEPPNNSFQFKDQSFSLDQCIVANESFDTTSKFDFVLQCCSLANQLNNVNAEKEKNQIWFSLESKNITELAEGEYNYSSESINKRAAMTFYGTVLAERKKMQITEGKFEIKKIGDIVYISFKLIVDNTNEINGNYFGSFNYEDRSQKALALAKPTHPLTVPKPQPSLFFIEIKKEGFYINNELCSLEELEKKAESWKKYDPDLLVWLNTTEKIPLKGITEIKKVLQKAKILNIYYSTSKIKDQTLEKVPSTPPPPPTPSFIIQINKDGNLVDNNYYSLKELSKKVELWQKNNPNGVVKLIASEEVSKERVIEVKETIGNAKVIYGYKINQYLINSDKMFYNTKDLDEKPEFSRGDVQQWIDDKLKRYAKRPDGWKYTIKYSFFIYKNGKTGDVHIRTSSNNPLMNENDEVGLITAPMPDWKPGKINGVAVDVLIKESYPTEFRFVRSDYAIKD